jgi:uncharacterized membrane protein YcaP (DUF421 family)
VSAQETRGTIEVLLALGRDVSDVGPAQMALRAIVIYVFMLVAVRVSGSRLLSKATAFDFIVAVLLGSVMSRAINGSAPFVSTLAGGAALLFMHWMIAELAVRAGWFGPLVKGTRIQLIDDGRVLEDGLSKAGLTRGDLEQALRLEGRQDDAAGIRAAYLERNGRISVVPYPREPRVVDVAVEPGIQTVRIDLR